MSSLRVSFPKKYNQQVVERTGQICQHLFCLFVSSSVFLYLCSGTWLTLDVSHMLTYGVHVSFLVSLPYHYNARDKKMWTSGTSTYAGNFEVPDFFFSAQPAPLLIGNQQGIKVFEETRPKLPMQVGNRHTRRCWLPGWPAGGEQNVCMCI